MLTLLERRPEVTLFVEIKRASLTRFGHEQVVARVVNALKPALSQCVVISFDLAAVHRVRQMGSVPIGWVLNSYDAHTRLKFEALQPEYLFCDHEDLPPGEGALWRGPWRWVIYEVDNLPLAQALAARGANYIETMWVREMGEAIVASQNTPPLPNPGA